MSNIKLSRDEVATVFELMNEFLTEADSVNLVFKGGGGIGYTLEAEFPIKVKDKAGHFSVEITGVKDW